jgi:hypothetical protein
MEPEPQAEYTVYVTSRSHGRHRQHYYVCTSYHRKGHAVCPNNRQAVMDAADREILGVVEDEILDQVIVEEVLRQAVATLIGTPEEATARLRPLEARSQEIETAIERWTDAIEAGGVVLPRRAAEGLRTGPGPRGA